METTPFVGEISTFAGDYAPGGWLLCDGASLHIYEYETLFMLIGTTYYGDGASSFCLPDLRGRGPVHFGSAVGLSRYGLGQQGGEENHTLSLQELPTHTHTLLGQTTETGGSQPSTVVQPYLAVSFMIALRGIYPTKN